MPTEIRFDAPARSNGIGQAFTLDDRRGPSSPSQALLEGVEVPEAELLNALPELVGPAPRSGSQLFEVRAAIKNPRPGHTVKIPVGGEGRFEVTRLDRGRHRVQFHPGGRP